MPKALIAAYLSIVVTFSSGCLSTRSYVDPSFSKAGYSDIKPVEAVHSVKIVARFQRNGKPLDKVNQQVQTVVERTLQETGIFEISQDASGGMLTVVVNNIFDLDEARSKGFEAGLTFGTDGATVTDYYEVTFTYVDGSGSKVAKSYEHALHSTIGDEAAPIVGIAPTDANTGFEQVIEDVVLNFVKDMQDSGLLVRQTEGRTGRFGA